MSLVDSILNTAKGYLNIREGSPEHQEIIDLYNSVRYGDAYQMTLNDPWCCAFVVAVFAANKASDIIPCYAACDQMINIFKNWGRWKSKWETPQAGDIIFYDWNGDHSSDHVGIVVSNTQGKLNIIEGNKSDTVSFRNIDSSSTNIIGYGAPNYSVSDSGDTDIPLPAQTTRPSAYDIDAISRLPLLFYGSKGVYVKILQLVINWVAEHDLEFINNKYYELVDIDGEYGPVTKSAVASYQMARNLEVDGVVGKETWTDLLIKMI